jgi:hypothetical protein
MAYKFNPFTGNFDDVGDGGAGSTPGGSDTQVQFNDGGSFGGDSGLTFDKTTNALTVGASTVDGGEATVYGDINLDDGGTYTTTLQVVTPTANRTISYPDATGTLALIAGSSGQAIYNNGGALAGISTMTFDGTSVTLAGRLINSLNGALSATGITGVPFALTGTWVTGGTATTTKPQVLIEPTGTTSAAWSTSGTGLGVNAASGFAGNLLDLQVNGTSVASVNSSGHVTLTRILGGSFYDIYNTTVPTARFQNNAFIVSGDIRLGAALNQGNSVLTYDANDTLAQRRSTNAQTFRCYGTYTDPSNYVRAALSSTSTAVTLAAETAGTGADDIPLNLTAAGTGTVKINSVAEVAVSSTVAGLPTAPTVGMMTRVTDATAPVVGSTVTGGGAAAALVWYNGASWTVLGV